MQHHLKVLSESMGPSVQQDYLVWVLDPVCGGHSTPSQEFKLIFNGEVALNSKTPKHRERTELSLVLAGLLQKREGVRRKVIWDLTSLSHDPSVTTCPSLSEVPLDPERSVLSKATRLQI